MLFVFIATENIAPVQHSPRKIHRYPSSTEYSSDSDPTAGRSTCRSGESQPRRKHARPPTPHWLCGDGDRQPYYYEPSDFPAWLFFHMYHSRRRLQHGKYVCWEKESGTVSLRVRHYSLNRQHGLSPRKDWKNIRTPDIICQGKPGMDIRKVLKRKGPCG